MRGRGRNFFGFLEVDSCPAAAVVFERYRAADI
jgi:hypothetical protein